MEGFSLAAAIRVRFAETDAQGVAHNSNYFVWFEVARVEFLERFAGGYQRLRDEGIESLVLESHARFLAPARLRRPPARPHALPGRARRALPLRVRGRARRRRDRRRAGRPTERSTRRRSGRHAGVAPRRADCASLSAAVSAGSTASSRRSAGGFGSCGGGFGFFGLRADADRRLGAVARVPRRVGEQLAVRRVDEAPHRSRLRGRPVGVDDALARGERAVDRPVDGRRRDDAQRRGLADHAAVHRRAVERGDERRRADEGAEEEPVRRVVHELEVDVRGSRPSRRARAGSARCRARDSCAP